MALVMFLIPSFNYPKAEQSPDKWETNYTYVFVHGYAGWGSYDTKDKVMPYWGMFGGDLMKYLNARGYDCRSASVDPGGSAWDRACELYAQLTGTRVDYGAAHSAKCKHERFGEDFTGRALVDGFSAKEKINFVGHSFGGTTILLLSDLLANGNAEERKAAKDASGLFKGGKGNWINSITCLATPFNGTTAYSIAQDIDAGVYERTIDEKIFSPLLESAGQSKQDGRISEDSASNDMLVDNAIRMTKNIKMIRGVYYFSIPCCCTVEDSDGHQTRDTQLWAEPFVRTRIERMGSYENTTPGGVKLDKKWWPNDGLVNTYSARAPFSAPQKDFDKSNIKAAVWNVMPVYRGDHQSLTGDMMHVNMVRTVYVDLLEMINGL